uniref:Mesothelin a n=1 Tax=Tetraodon nigroviridis TaxID=99883 RepID=H3BWV9_TETNG
MLHKLPGTLLLLSLSSSVLQGFTCLSVSTFKKTQVKKLVKACRRKGRNKVLLQETQLTCMYNHISKESDVTSFDLYPPDVLLYYDYSLVPPSLCRAYFTQLGEADFSVFSPALSYKRKTLLVNALRCLGVFNGRLTRDQVEVLGNMCCLLSPPYIRDSDPLILEKLKNCADISSDQVAAVETLLLSGNTPYGAPSVWNLQTLKNLETLPLYLTSAFFEKFDSGVLRNNGVSKQKIRQFKRETKRSLQRRSKTTFCTVGNITQVTISDPAFPFDYDDITQFEVCLSPQTVKDNLAAITDKVLEEEYLIIVLSKLREAYMAHSTIAESQVKLLGPASRVASTTDINMWNISEIDTLSALMDSSNGEWEQSLLRAIIRKYLSITGNKLGSAELNSLGGANLCTLDISNLSSISTQSIKDADALEISNCTTEMKKVLFALAKLAFSTTARSTAVPASTYQLLKSFLRRPREAGAPLSFIQELSTSNVNMDMSTFTSLDENVVLSLTVSEVQGLLGSNLIELKSYENQTLVQSWIRLQPQSQLDTLAIGLTGG